MVTDGTILIVEPVREIRETKTRILERGGYKVVGLSSANAALQGVTRPRVALVLLDLPEDGTKWATLDALRSRHPAIPVIVMQTPARLEDAVEAMKRGAADYLAKSLDPTRLLRSVGEAIDDSATADPPETAGLIERSAAMHGLMDRVRRVAPSNSNVLLWGESGVGKEVVARYIHGISPRRSEEFVAVNCASLSDEILENELFGHERGAFTGANERKLGVFEVADGGTLFLDEVGEMGLRCQAKLLRAIERKEFRRVGGTSKIKVDVRIIAATNTDLQGGVEARAFRKDLYYRLNVINLRIPPLRERAEVIPEMITQFLQEFTRNTSRRVRQVNPETLTKLVEYEWPGNVRELRNVIESLVLTVPGSRIDVADLPPTIRDAPPRQELRIALGVPFSDIERETLRAYIERYGSKKEAARALNIPLRTFHAKARRYGLATSRGRGKASIASFGQGGGDGMPIQHPGRRPTRS
jgi:two-component system nitrogen regulation response regulator NtrX